MGHATRSETTSERLLRFDGGLALREVAFNALVGLAAKRSSGTALLGDTAGLASIAYRKSLIGRSYPSFWMEAPLKGEPGFDLHVYYDRGQVLPGERFAPGAGFGMQDLFDWYFGTETGGVGVGFAHDLRDGRNSVGAYVNFNRRPLANRRGFFASLGAQDACDYAESLVERLPESWNPWYLGLFPNREGAGVRVGAFVSKVRQEAYANDPRALATDLSQAGFEALDESMLARLSMMAALPFKLELQLDATSDGTGDTLGADITLDQRSVASVRTAFAEGGPADVACRLLEGWGIADTRWHLIADASTSRLVPLVQENVELDYLMTCTPAFIKAKWIATQPQSAKVYFQCASRPIGNANDSETFVVLLARSDDLQ